MHKMNISKYLQVFGLILTVGLSVSIKADCREFLKVPFHIDRNRIIIPAAVNGSRPLRLILDTGMGFDGVYLFHKEVLDLIDTTGAIEVRIPGAGSGEASAATMTETGRIEFGDITINDQRVLVSHSANTQTFPTDGVTGWNFFGHYIVEIDYDKQCILLRDTAYVHSDSSWLVLPIELKKGLPFLEVKVEVVEGELVPMTVYIDLASGDALELLVHPGQKFTLPDNLTKSYLGTGLSGDINGHHGRSHRLQIGKYELNDIATAFAPAGVRSKQEGADGILGNDLMRRFNIIFDYPHSRLFIRPNKTFKVPFE
ncbi:MAG: aspartyl protease family protein [candidate division Zixibacteria bacterium]|nr:aspartyl protease family protein [candidate division Zixibacteria bacterium]